MVAVLGGVEDLGEGGEGGVGDGGGDGGLPAGLVPQDRQVDGGEQPGPEGRREVGEDVAEVGQLVYEGGVGCAGRGSGEPASSVSAWVRCWWSSAKRVRMRARMAAA